MFRFRWSVLRGEFNWWSLEQENCQIWDNYNAAAYCYSWLMSFTSSANTWIGYWYGCVEVFQVLIKPIDNSSPINFRSGLRIPNCWIKFQQAEWNFGFGSFCATDGAQWAIQYRSLHHLVGVIVYPLNYCPTTRRRSRRWLINCPSESVMAYSLWGITSRDKK